MLCLVSFNVFAETIKLKITYNGVGVAGHTVIVVAGAASFGQGVTDGGGNLTINAGTLTSKDIQLAGRKVTHHSRKEWTIAGLITLDNNNFVHVKMDEIIKKLIDGTGTSEKLIAIAWGLTEDSPEAQKEAINETITGALNDPDFKETNKEVNAMLGMMTKRPSSKTKPASKPVKAQTSTQQVTKSDDFSIANDIQSFTKELGGIRKDALLMQQQTLQGKISLSENTIRKRNKRYKKLKEIKDVNQDLLSLAKVEFEQAKTRKSKYELNLNWVNARLKGKVSRKTRQYYKGMLKKTDYLLDDLKEERKKLLAKKKPEEFTRFGLKRKIAQLGVTLKRKQFSRKTTFRRTRKVILDKEIAAIKVRLKKYKTYLAEQRAIEATKKAQEKKVETKTGKKQKEKK
ncbi:hypothetical protein [Microscilla marina]|uniref:Uncharacterized protein n=1 Tax=Microscilla marina ATCC 23134 TaxID=313606 RepID=A1ZWJ7_MICM2|nr:hypothetical protein [Microscilla marina]EAY25236.1 hypothetical protein M23134_07973 [Microscilla marina ATCC 23134]